MKIVKCSISALITLALIFILNNSWVLSGNRLPPLGKFLDPFHGFWQNIEPKNKKGKKFLNIKGLRTNVAVVYDSIMIPHIFAKNDEDLYLAQGYVTAIHRLWQMEFLTHAAAGRVAEITGPGTNDAILNFDRYQRRLGMAYAAGHAFQSMMADPTSKMMVEKYTEGINQYIQYAYEKRRP